MKRFFNITIISKKTFEILDLSERLKEYFKIKVGVKSDISELTINKNVLNLIIISLKRKNQMDMDSLNKKIRMLSNCSFLVITNHSSNLHEINSRVRFLKTPFSLSNLITISENILKKDSKNSYLSKNNLFDFSVEKSTLHIYESKKTVKLTEMESKFFDYLCLQNKPSSKKDLLLNVWNHQSQLDTHTLESLVYRLRLKIELDPRTPKILISRKNKYLIKNTVS